MNSYNKLIKNTIIFFIGNIGSKLITFVLVPLYTYYLTQAEYGTIDLFTVSISLLVPLITCSIHEAALRFAVEDEYNNSYVLLNSTVVFLLGYIIFLISSPFLLKINFFSDYKIYFYIILFFQTLNQLLQQFLRGIGKIRVYSFNGVLNTFLLGILNIIFIVVFGLGINGYMLSLVFSSVISYLYLLSNLTKYISFDYNKIDKNIIKKMLSYSIPMMPNSMMWWIVSSSGRIFITNYIGISANGIFAVANKIPSIINIVTQVFSQAWQISIFEEFDSKDSGKFYSNIFSIYSSTLFIMVSIIITFLKPIFLLVFSENYFDAAYVVPFLLLSSMFSALSGFVGVTYTATKKTKGLLTTSVIGGVSSIIFNLIFIKNIGLVGAGLASLLSFLSMLLYRIYDTRKYMKLDINWFMFCITLFLVLVQTYVLFSSTNIIVDGIINVSVIIIIIFLHKKTIINLINYTQKIVKIYIIRERY